MTSPRQSNIHDVRALAPSTAYQIKKPVDCGCPLVEKKELVLEEVKVVKKATFAKLAGVFFVVGIITLLILWIFKPVLVLQRDALGVPTAQLDWTRIIITSVIVGLIAAIIAWLLS